MDCHLVNYVVKSFMTCHFMVELTLVKFFLAKVSLISSLLTLVTLGDMTQIETILLVSLYHRGPVACTIKSLRL
jgi:hypothetical protein